MYIHCKEEKKKDVNFTKLVFLKASEMCMFAKILPIHCTEKKKSKSIKLGL